MLPLSAFAYCFDSATSPAQFLALAKLDPPVVDVEVVFSVVVAVVSVVVALVVEAFLLDPPQPAITTARTMRRSGTDNDLSLTESPFRLIAKHLSNSSRDPRKLGAGEQGDASSALQ